MATITYNKLVRDRIPEIMKAEKKRAVWRAVTGVDFRHVLLMKVIEEAREFDTTKDKIEKLKEEADVQEVLLKARQLYGYSAEDVELARKQQAEADDRFGLLTVLGSAAIYIKQPCAETEAGIQESLSQSRSAAGYTSEEIETFRVEKLQLKGAFERGVYMEYVEEA